MDWSDRIFSYCERGQNPEFWAEPFNALSNGAFLVASLAALIVWALQPRERRGLAELGLALLVAVIGVGSFLFHTYATRATAIGDIGPIGLFMFLYAAYAFRRFLGLPWIGVLVGLVGFAWLVHTAFDVPCPMEWRGLVKGRRCLNGTIGYLPAFGLLATVGLVSILTRPKVAPWLLAAAAVFAGSLTARSVDLSWCGSTGVMGALRGTHAIWHLLNATTLLLLLMAALRHGAPRVRPDRAANVAPEAASLHKH